MHTLWSRGNALLTNFLLVAAAMAVLVTITDFLTVPTMPEVDISVKKLNFFQPNNSGDDQVSLKTSVTADLRAFWTWNTKQIFVYLQAEYVTERNGLNQVSIYDRIIRSQDKANLNWLVSQEYKMIDQGNYLRGRQLNMTLCWDIMPRVGALRQYFRSVDVGSLPSQYVSTPQDWGAWHVDPPQPMKVDEI